MSAILEAATEATAEGSHASFLSTGEFQGGNRFKIDSESKLGVDTADGSVEFQSPAMQVFF